MIMVGPPDSLFALKVSLKLFRSCVALPFPHQLTMSHSVCDYPYQTFQAIHQKKIIPFHNARSDWDYIPS
jgi:hypothetical protein